MENENWKQATIKRFMQQKNFLRKILLLLETK